MNEDERACIYASVHARVSACSFAYIYTCMNAYMQLVGVHICMHVHAVWKLSDGSRLSFSLFFSKVYKLVQLIMI